MKAEILATGDEILTGAVIDSNSAYIAQKLEEAGIEVVRHGCAGDNVEAIATILKEISTRADMAVVTGGLGLPFTHKLALPSIIFECKAFTHHIRGSGRSLVYKLTGRLNYGVEPLRSGRRLIRIVKKQTNAGKGSVSNLDYYNKGLGTCLDFHNWK